MSELSNPDETPAERLTEGERVIQWRLEELIRAGWSELPAAKVAHSQIDLHEACALVANGCPAETAAEILL